MRRLQLQTDEAVGELSNNSQSTTVESGETAVRVGAQERSEERPKEGNLDHPPVLLQVLDDEHRAVKGEDCRQGAQACQSKDHCGAGWVLRVFGINACGKLSSQRRGL